MAELTAPLAISLSVVAADARPAQPQPATTLGRLLALPAGLAVEGLAEHKGEAVARGPGAGCATIGRRGAEPDGRALALRDETCRIRSRRHPRDGHAPPAPRRL